MRRCGWLMVALCVPGAVRAQEPLSVEGAVARALATHPSVGAAEAAVSRAEAAWRETRAGLLPAAGVEAQLTRFEEPMVVAPLHGLDLQRPPLFDRTLAQAALSVGYTVWDGGGRGARVQRATAQVDAAQHTVDVQRAALIAEVVRRYAAVLTTREVAAANAARLAALERERARAERLLAQGRVARVALLRAEAGVAAARADAESAAAEAVLAEHALARLLSVDARALAAARLDRLTVRGATPTQEHAVASGLAANAELRRLRAQVAAARAAVSEARAQEWPRLQLGGRYTRYASALGDAGGEWQTSLQLNYALFTAGARPAAAQRAAAEVHQAEAELASAELRVADAIERAHALLTSARARSTALAAAVQQMEEVVRIEQLALDSGAGLQTDYLSAEAELLRSRAALTDARFAEVVAAVELARAAGHLDAAWVVANVGSGG